MKGGDVSNLIDSAIDAGRHDFWGAAPWVFKENHTTVTTTESTETVDLPDDFDGLVSVVNHENTVGRKLSKLTPDEYSRMIPYAEGLSEGTPGFYKVYYDQSNAVWRLALYPVPDSEITLYVTYHTITVNGEIPNKYIGGLITGISKYLLLPGSQDWLAANQAFLMEIERLKQVDNVDVETIGRFLDSSDEPASWNFEEYVRVRAG